MKYEEAIIKGTNSELDEQLASVSEPVVFSAVIDDERKIIKMRHIKNLEFCNDSVASSVIEGIWIEDGYMVPEITDIVETSTNGKHIKTRRFEIGNFCLSIVEFEKCLQVAITNETEKAVYFSDYVRRSLLGAVIMLFENWDGEDIFEVCEALEELR